MPTDLLDRLLISLAVRLHAFAYCEIQSGWNLTFGAMNAITIHYVLNGAGFVRISNGASVAFRPNHIVIVPARVEQSLGEADAQIGVAAAEANAIVVDDGLVRFTAGDGTRDILVICGTITATYGGALGVFDHLREPLVEDLSSSNILRQVFELLVEEMSRPTIGTQVLTESLMKQCLVLVLRQQLSRRGVGSPFFAVLQDERLARAISAVLEQPAGAHSVASLATVAGMSRSSFAERFASTYSQSPLDFVRKVRLRLAATLLSTTDLPIKVLAKSIGYSSRSYFSRAFRAAYGVDPKTFRTFGGYAEKEPEAVADDAPPDNKDENPS
jgi:AraC-like DNA-binding protein